MNGVHDMGGMHGFGPVVREADEPVFHYDWERRILALRQAAGALGKWNLDISRHSNERLPPAVYLAASYYERWVLSFEMLLIEHGLATQQEIESGKAATPAPVDVLPVLRADAVPARFRKGRSARVDAAIPARFSVGEEVLARNITTAGHTRLPRYARGKRGTVQIDHGVFIFPDSHAADRDPKPQHLYNVRFTALELWGAGFPRNQHVHIDLWDDHLDPA
jgi:nitrile hydratase